MIRHSFKRKVDHTVDAIHLSHQFLIPASGSRIESLPEFDLKNCFVLEKITAPKMSIFMQMILDGVLRQSLTLLTVLTNVEVFQIR